MDSADDAELGWRAALSALLDGEEPDRPASAVAEHLAGCPDCSAWLDRAIAANERVRTLPVVEPALGERVVDAVDVRLCGCAVGGPCACRNCQCGPHCTCHESSGPAARGRERP